MAGISRAVNQMFLLSRRYIQQSIAIVFFLISFVLCSSVFAHQNSTAYLKIITNDSGSELNTFLYWRLQDAEQEIGFDQDGDGILYWSDVVLKSQELTNYINKNITIDNCDIKLSTVESWESVVRHKQGYVAVPIQFECFTSLENINLQYSAFKNINQHKLLVYTATEDDSVGNDILNSNNDFLFNVVTPKQGFQFIELNNTANSFLQFIWQGILHIWIGIDHIIFLLALLIPLFNYLPTNKKSAQYTDESSSSVVQALRPILRPSLILITTFTLAHSLTLSLVALGWIAPIISWVEVAIAFSVAVAGLSLLFRHQAPSPYWVFAFGLLHGMGFAAVLAELVDDQQLPLMTILSFNLGVEIGQIALLCLFVPVLHIASRWSEYRRLAIISALGISSMASYWMVVRWP